VDDRGDRVEEGEGAFSGFGCDGLGELRSGEWAGRDDRRVVGKSVDPLSDDRDLGVLLDRARYLGGEGFAVDS
jgi:hypothetical protein